MENLTLQQLLAERVTIFANSERPKEMIDAGIEKLFKEVVTDAFSGYGDMGKAVKEAVKAALPANISDMFELTRYNALIANALRQQWLSSGVEGDMLRRANEAMNAALKDDVIPDQVSLRELLQEFVEQHKDDAASEQWEHPEIRFVQSDYGALHIHFDPEPEGSHKRGGYARNERSDWSLKNRISVHEEGDRKGRVYSAQIDDNPIGKDFSIRSRWERLIAALYFGAAKLVVDCEADDFSYGLYD